MTSSTTAPGPTRSATSGRAPRTALALASLGFFLIALDILIVNVALTTIGRELGGSTSGLQWVIDAYRLLFASLPLVVATPVSFVVAGAVILLAALAASQVRTA